ncbi:glycoside hydrolase family 2 protein [Wenxinia marina]|uniref:beta-mannosidase n=1 Tax=Wenxinia marina DSM 24838 TaxID=1123501 RepID=A0A0D0QEW8_9RHOB|nr:glycoside hydrolase family 2 protein [Wenxinia marina]KIQ70877.1 Beta-galactosidase/beta-glucuronidase [Wenxinia marina DSM 24838]GGL56588.1 beta-mannosidase [Wenxinia marina]
MTSLSGPWALADEDGAHGCEIRLPGEDGITALHRAGLIPDPYWGRNEYECRWVCERDWVARRTFEHDGTPADLVMDEVDTVAEVRINGQVVAETRSAFRSYRVPVGDALKAGGNEIEITFRSPVREGAKIAADLPFPVPQTYNCPIPHGNLLRKQHCDFGWDWNIALAQFGVHGALRLEPSDAPRIERLRVWQDHAPGRVRLTVAADYTGPAQEAELSIAGATATARFENGRLRAELEIEDPVLWWPAGHGEPVLHDLTVTAGDLTEARRIGLRQIDLVSEPDEAGRSFGLRVNGRDVFAKGANWIPADALNGRISRDGVRDLLQSAVDANMNMLRVWGGGRYEPDWFYDLCDEMGLMVWQDFMFACSLYPSTEEFLAEVAAEAEEQAARLQHHACLALWCGDNELVGALTWYPESRADRDRYLVSYDRLNRTVEQGLKRADPAANWWPSSPSPGPLSFGDAWHDDSSGDMHFWSVWHESKDFEHYRDVRPRFCSEFGFQSYPSMDVIRTFADPADWNIANPIFESHQKNVGGNERIAGTMFRYFRWPQRFEDFVWVSQLQQALAIKTAVTSWRSLRPHCMGTLYWQLNDTWPVCSWSSLDYGGGWKLLHHFARDFYRPVTVVAVPEGDTLRLIGVNDTAEAVELSVTVYATALDGAAREIDKGSASVGGTAAPLAEIDLAQVGANEVVTFGWTASNGDKAGDIFNPRPWKAYDLPDPKARFDVRQDGESWTLTLSVDAMAFFLTAEADVPGRWDRAGVHLGPGHTTDLTFTPRDGGAIPRFTLRHLHSATMAAPEGVPA